MPTATAIELDPQPSDALREPRIAIAAEERYLAQRQPAGLAAALAAGGQLSGFLDVRRLDAARLLDVDLVVARGRSRTVLALLALAESLGVATVNRRAAIAAVLDKASMARALAAAGIPTPTTRIGTPRALGAAARPSEFPLVVKPVFGDNGRGVCVVRTRDELVAVRFPERLGLAQPFLRSDGWDLKLYVVGSEVFAVRKPSPIGPVRAPAHRVEVTPALRALALRCGALFRLELFGVDCIETARGPVVIEVNDFPNYSGIEHADGCLARYVVARARRTGRGGGRR